MTPTPHIVETARAWAGPDHLDPAAVAAVIADAFGIPADRITRVTFAKDAHPAATVIADDLDIGPRVCEALGIPLAGVAAVDMDTDHVHVHLIDGTTTHIPLEREDQPCPA